jgi:hypothetical protein
MNIMYFAHIVHIVRGWGRVICFVILKNWALQGVILPKNTIANYIALSPDNVRNVHNIHRQIARSFLNGRQSPKWRLF